MSFTDHINPMPEITDAELEAHAQFEPTENLQGKNAPIGDDFVAENEED